MQRFFGIFQATCGVDADVYMQDSWSARRDMLKEFLARCGIHLSSNDLLADPSGAFDGGHAPIVSEECDAVRARLPGNEC